MVWLRRLFAAVLFAAGLGLAAVALTVGLLNIEPVRRALFEAALEATQADDLTVEIGALEGVWPGALRLRDLTLGDAEGTWARLTAAELDWRPLALWHGEVHITRLSIDGLDVARLPAGEETQTAFALPEMPRLPFALRLDTFSLRNIRLGAGLTGEDVLFEGDGHFVHTRRESDIALSVTRQDGRPGHIEGRYRFLAGPERGLLTLSVEDGGEGRPSTVARLAGLDGVERLTVAVDGQSLAGLMTGTARIDAVKRDGSRVLKLEANAHGAMAERVNLEFRMRAEGEMVARELDFIDGARDVTASGRLAQTARGDYRLENARFEAGGLSVTGEADLQPGAGRTGIAARGMATGAERLFDLEDGAALGPMEWRLRGHVDDALTEAIIEEAVLSGMGGEARFAGRARLDLGDGAFEAAGDIEAAMAELAPMGRLIGQPMQGEAQATLTSFTYQDGEGRGTVSLRAGPIATDDEGLDRLLADGLNADGALAFSDAGALAVTDLTVTAGDRLTLEGHISLPVSGSVSGAGTLTVAEIADLLADDVLRGALAAEAEIDGARIALKATLTDGAAAGIDVRRAVLEAALLQGGTGTATLNLNGEDGQARIATQVTLPEAGGARFDGIEATLFGAPLTGAVALSPDWIASGEIGGRRLPLAPLGQLAGIEIDGRGDLTLTLADAQGRQDAQLVLLSRRMSVEFGEGLTLEGVTLNAALRDIAGAASVDASLSADGGGGGNTRFSRISATLRGPMDDLALTAHVDGERLSLRAEAVALAFEGRWRGETLSADMLNLAIGDTSMRLAEPLAIEMREGVTTVPRLVLGFSSPSGEGRLTGSLTMRPRGVRLSLDGETMPLALLTPLLPVDAVSGTVSGTATLDTAREVGAAAFSFRDVGLADSELDVRPVFHATLEGNWAQRRLTVTAAAQGISEEPFLLNASLPLVRDPAGAWPALPARGPVSGDLTWRGPIASLMALADLTGQRLTGDADVALSASGDISAPVFSGTATLRDGVFENYTTGTVLRGLEVQIEGARSEMLTFALKARDSGSGQLDAEGTLTLAADAARAVSMRARFTDFQAVRRRDLVASFTGNFDVDGAALPPTREAPLILSGALRTTDAHFHIPEQLPGGVAHITVIEVYGPDDVAADIAVAAEEPFPAEFDLSLVIGNPPAQVTGRGVNALWTGELQVTGNVENPRVTGTLRQLRGTLDFAGKTFTLSRGLVTFQGETPPDPTIDIALEYRRSGFTATVSVTGRGSAPQIALSSQPALPQDEIISRILFEKGVGELTAMEAAQLANTAAELSGTGGIGGFGLLGQMQQSLGLDVLRVDQGASGATTVAAGKYLREGFYVGVEQGALASDSSVRVEVDITDNISVDTKVGQDASAGAGINWKWDY